MSAIYTRSYGIGEESLRLPPENYDGTAFSDRERREDCPSAEAEPASAPCHGHTGHGGCQSPFRIPLLGNLFGGGDGFLSSISTEELLIIGLALFLLLSKDGDMECALMLLLLLFIRD